MALIVYIVLSLTRSLLMIPCTPFVLAGAISFPQWPLIVFVISFTGIVLGAFLVYSFPSFGNYDEFLEEKYPAKIAALKEKMQGKYAFAIVAGWSFFSTRSYRCNLLCGWNCKNVFQENGNGSTDRRNTPCNNIYISWSRNWRVAEDMTMR